MIAGLLLAGGASRRFGGNKLVAPLAGQPVLRWSAEALAAAVNDVYVVVPMVSDEVREALEGVRVRWVENRDAHTGMASSIRAGIAALPAETVAVVVTLGDQPTIDAGDIRRVVDRWRDAAAGTRAVVAEYVDGRGHPALFGAELFPALSALAGDRGARELLASLGDAVETVGIARARPADVDTREALETLDRGLPRRA